MEDTLWCMYHAGDMPDDMTAERAICLIIHADKWDAKAVLSTASGWLADNAWAFSTALCILDLSPALRADIPSAVLSAKSWVLQQSASVELALAVLGMTATVDGVYPELVEHAATAIQAKFGDLEQVLADATLLGEWR